VPSQELKDYQKQMELYPFGQGADFLVQKNFVQHWVNEGYLLEVKALFCFKRKRIFTLKNEPKKMDVSNRIKALHDCLGKILGIDDCLFFRIHAEKALCDENLNEMVIVEIAPIV